MTTLLLCLLAVTARGIDDRPLILDGAADPYASEFVFFGTGYGIYAYSRTTAAWSRITTANGLPDNRARAIALDDGKAGTLVVKEIRNGSASRSKLSRWWLMRGGSASLVPRGPPGQPGAILTTYAITAVRA